MECPCVSLICTPLSSSHLPQFSKTGRGSFLTVHSISSQPPSSTTLWPGHQGPKSSWVNGRNSESCSWWHCWKRWQPFNSLQTFSEHPMNVGLLSLFQVTFQVGTWGRKWHRPKHRPTWCRRSRLSSSLGSLGQRKCHFYLVHSYSRLIYSNSKYK